MFSLFFLTGVGVYVGACVCIRTNAHTARGVLKCEPRGWDKTLGGPEESRRTKSRHECISICVQSTPVYIYAGRRDEISVDSLLFSFDIFFLPKRENKRYERITEKSNPHGFEPHRPLIKGTKFLLNYCLK